MANCFGSKALRLPIPYLCKRLQAVAIAILLSGCASAPKLSYQSQLDTDPAIVFGDRFGGGAVNSPARSFGINYKDAALNKCADFEEVGTTSNHWMKFRKPTIEIKTPVGKAVAIRSVYIYSNGITMTSCALPAVMFSPEPAGKYSVDVSVVSRKCSLSIVRIQADGKQEEVKDAAVLPACDRD